MSSNEQLALEIACLREEVDSLVAREPRRRKRVASSAIGAAGAAIGMAFGVVSTLAIRPLANPEIFVQHAPTAGTAETALRAAEPTLSVAIPHDVRAFVPSTPRTARVAIAQPSGPATPMTAMTSLFALAPSSSADASNPTMPAPDFARVLSAAGMTGALSPEAITEALSALEAH